MKIVSLQAENFKRLKAVEITVDGQNIVVLSGRNAQGKSSVLDAIWAALAGRDGVKQTARPIRDGESKARVEIAFDDIVVTRKWSGAGSTLEVKSAAGAKFPSPQKMLDTLIGRLSFDPLAFAQSDPKAQLATLIDLAELDFDPDDLAARRKEAYDQRTLANRDVKNCQARLDGLPTPPGDAPLREVNVAELTDKIRMADEKERLLREYEEIQVDIDALTRRREAVVERGRELSASLGDEDRESLIELLSHAEETNRNFRLIEQRTEIAASLQDAELDAKSQTAIIEECDQIKTEGIARAKFPVAGLSFDEEGVLYNGVPFQQASAAERLRVSVAMAMAMNPKIRVIRITDGSLLDSDNMRMIEEMAKDQDFQVWVERVDESGEVGVVIEDGEVKA